MIKKPKAATLNGKAVSHGLPAEILTPSGLAVFLQLPETVVVAEAQAGRIPGRCIAGEWRFLRRAIADWLQRADGPPVRARPPVGVARDFGDDAEAVIEAIYSERNRHPVRG